jgi:hypothetical protein
MGPVFLAQNLLLDGLTADIERFREFDWNSIIVLDVENQTLSNARGSLLLSIVRGAKNPCTAYDIDRNGSPRKPRNDADR